MDCGQQNAICDSQIWMNTWRTGCVETGAGQELSGCPELGHGRVVNGTLLQCLACVNPGGYLESRSKNGLIRLV
jgi:hypothetical protein